MTAYQLKSLFTSEQLGSTKQCPKLRLRKAAEQGDVGAGGGLGDYLYIIYAAAAFPCMCLSDIEYAKMVKLHKIARLLLQLGQLGFFLGQ